MPNYVAKFTTKNAKDANAIMNLIVEISTSFSFEADDAGKKIVATKKVISGTTVQDEVLKALKGVPSGMTREAINRSMVRLGYAPTSGSSSVSRLLKDGKVTANGDRIKLK